MILLVPLQPGSSGAKLGFSQPASLHEHSWLARVYIFRTVHFGAHLDVMVSSQGSGEGISAAGPELCCSESPLLSNCFALCFSLSCAGGVWSAPRRRIQPHPTPSAPRQRPLQAENFPLSAGGCQAHKSHPTHFETILKHKGHSVSFN